MNRLGLDLRHARRLVARDPMFSLAVVATLALGISLVTVVYGVVHGVLIEPLPFANPDRLVMVWQTDPSDGSKSTASYPDFRDFEISRSFTGLAGFQTGSRNIGSTDQHPMRVTGAAVSHDLFEVLGIEPIIGRTFDTSHDQPGAAPVVLISETLWKERFRSDRDVLDETLEIDGKRATILGVIPDSLRFPTRDTEIWIPLEPVLGEFRDQRGVHNILIVARLGEGVSLTDAQSEMTSIANRLAREYPGNEGRGALVEPLLEAFVGETTGTLTMLMLSVGVILLIACANTAGLLLAKGVDRQKEIAVRAGIGASRGRIVAQLLVESGFLALLGGTAGVGLAFLMVEILVRLLPATFPRMTNIGIDPIVVVTAMAISILSALIFGLLPAIQISRLQPAVLMQGSGRGFSARRSVSRNLLVVGEVALAVTLVTAALLLARSFDRLINVDPGFQASRVVSFDLTLPAARYPVPSQDTYPEWPEATGFYDRVLERIDAIPGVESAAIALNHPLKRGWTSQVTIDGRPMAPGPIEETRLRPVTARYFETAGISLISGRTILPSDRLGTEQIVVINEAFANKFFPSSDPVGASVRFWGESRRIVGVVGDVRFTGLGEPRQPAIYPSLQQLPMSEFSILVRSPLGEALVPTVQKAIWSADPDLAIYNVGSLDRRLHDSVEAPRFRTVLMLVFAGSAGILSIIGLYSLVAWQVRQARREIGIRIALGARSEQITSMTIRGGLSLAALGLVTGTVGAVAASRILEGFLFEVSPLDPLSYTAVALTILVAAFLASWIPARTATRVEPVEVLRVD